MPSYALQSYPDAPSLALAAGSQLLDVLEKHGAAGPAFALALSGGRIARPFYEAIVSGSRARKVSPHQVEFFFADERAVPLNDPESNYRLAHESLFEPLAIQQTTVHAIDASKDAAAAAERAEGELRRVTAAKPGAMPVLDLVILGMGEDGHVASLFPGAPAAAVTTRAAYVAVRGPKPPPQRVTLTYGCLAAARQVWVLVSGPSKAGALRVSLAPASITPLGRVLQARKSSLIFSDCPIA